MRTYTTKTGKTQYMPSFAWVTQCDNEGFCLACGGTQCGVEPDARRYTCESCGAAKVYGGEELLIIGLVDDSENDSDDDVTEEL